MPVDREKVLAAIDTAIAEMPWEDSRINLQPYQALSRLVDAIRALPESEPTCSTCGGTKVAPFRGAGYLGAPATAQRCPDCEPPTAGEVVVPPMVKLALNTLLNHVEPGWDNCKFIVEKWLKGEVIVRAVETGEGESHAD